MHSSSKIKTELQAFNSLARTCSKMERCVSDIRRSLYRWGITESSQQERIVEKLTQHKFIDQQRYAEAYVRDKLIGGRWGVMKIRAGLRAKQIDNELINQAIEQNIESKTVRSRLEDNIGRQLEKMVKQSDTSSEKYRIRVKLFRRAASQGFDIEDINHILDKLLDE